VLGETACLITDVQMPGLSGLELQEALLAQGSRTPVILITGYPNEKHHTRALGNGAVGYLSKPFDEESLIECLNAAIVSREQVAHGCITLAATTSMQDSGLLGHILPLFRAATGIDVHVTAVGTGQALAIAARGGADALLVHDRAGEEKFVADGFGLDRRDVMYNHFLIVGPTGDPARIRGSKNFAQALSQIAEAEARFASRGDDSGTHRMELRLWKAAGARLDPNNGWYRDMGQGMGATLKCAAAMKAYTLTDRATLAYFKNRQGLEIFGEVEPALYNSYSSILTNPAKWPKVKFAEANIWHQWITTKPGLDAVLSYRINGEELFFPPRAQA
jgi:tungstate transport system substrate-binding protein